MCLTFQGFAEQDLFIKVIQTEALNESGDDISHLKMLAAGVGYEFEPNEKTTEGLKKIGIKRIRCINVDPLPGNFDDQGQFHISPVKISLDSHLDVCRKIKAIPHIVIASGLHPDLRLQAENFDTDDERLFGLLKNEQFGPTDWNKFRNYIKAYFKYVLITCRMTTAQFEVGNEPDVGGCFVTTPPRPEMGSRKLYHEYLNLYRNVAMAATEFEAEHRDLHIRLGGPALAWAFTYRFGEFNWSQQFLKDINTEKIKLDFIGIHYYGNISPIRGDRKDSAYPTFSEMYAKLREWRNQYTPEAKICVTEWGGSYHTDLTEKSMLHNGGNVAASFAASFLYQMLVEGVDEALYLVTTDLRQNKDGEWLNIWGWPSLFTNPYFGDAYPKAPYHVFDMVNRMAPNRIVAEIPDTTLGTIASVDEKGRMTILLWNHSHTIPEFDVGKETGKDEKVQLQIIDADKFFKGSSVQIKRQLVSRTISNALYLFQEGQKLDDRANLQTVDMNTVKIIGGRLDWSFIQPPSSVSFIEVTPALIQ